MDFELADFEFNEADMETLRKGIKAKLLRENALTLMQSCRELAITFFFISISVYIVYTTSRLL